MPFSHNSISNSNLNVKIALNFFVIVLSKIAVKDGIYLKLKKIHKYNLLHAFKYNDLSKEAIMAIAESLIS